MNSYGIRKTIDQLGRITVPKAFRTATGMDIGDEVEICQTNEGILIKPISNADTVVCEEEVTDVLGGSYRC